MVKITYVGERRTDRERERGKEREKTGKQSHRQGDIKIGRHRKYQACTLRSTL